MKFIFSVLLLCIAFSCKDEIYSTIPTAEVSYKLKLNSADAWLNAGIGAYLCITQKRLETDRLGFGGLLIVNGNGIGIETVNLYAYDLACPNEAARNALVVPEDSSKTGTAFTAKCLKCGAVFDIIGGYGTPQSGSKYYLRAYRVMKTMNNGEYLVAQ
jgi:hypothetical protein